MSNIPNCVSYITMMLLLFNGMNGQISCSTKREATTNAGPLTVTATLCSDDNHIYIDIDYPTYSNAWFGIVLGDGTMTGAVPLAYTTGKQLSTRPEALYAYTITNKNLNGVTYDAANDWSQVLKDETNGIRIIYKQLLSDTPWTYDETSIKFGYALAATGLTLKAHTSNSDAAAPPELLFPGGTSAPTTLTPTATPTTDTSSPTKVPSASPSSQPSSAPYQPGTPTKSPSVPTNVPSISPSIPVDPTDFCVDRKDATTTAGPLAITLALCTDDDMIYIDISYSAWANDWFGIVLGDGSMIGDALAYTTGKSGANRAEALYSYTNTQKGLQGVTYNPSSDWTEVHKDETNGIRIIYKQSLSNTPYTLSTSSISFGYATGSGMTLGSHLASAYEGYLTFLFEGATLSPTTSNPTNPTNAPSADTPSPTKVPSASPSQQPSIAPYEPGTPSVSPSVPTIIPSSSPTNAPTYPVVCNDNGKVASVTAGTLAIELVLCSEDDMIYIDIVHDAYSTHWFGVVLASNTMIGDALVWTTGKTTNTRALGLYSYTNTAKTIGGVNYVSSGDWTNVFTDSVSGRILYKQALSNTDWTFNTNTISFGYAIGSSLALGFHSVAYEGDMVFDFLSTGAPSEGPTLSPILPQGQTAPPTTDSPTNAPFNTGDVCANGIEDTVDIDNEIIIRMILCDTDDMVYIDITYNQYANNWFGVVFSDEMIGDALVFTTGHSSESLSKGLYSYSNTKKAADGVTRNANTDWTEVLTEESSGSIQVIYKTLLSNTQWTIDTDTIPIGYALGSTLTLGWHGNGYGAENILNMAGIPTPDPTTEPTETSGKKGCNKQDLLPASDTFDDFEFTLFINCDDDTVTLTLTYNAYDANWFGIVFSKNMIGDALIYTTGKSDDRSEGLYVYHNSRRVIDSVVYDMEKDWTQISTEENDGSITVIYTQSLEKTSFTRETEEVVVRWAYGNSLTLAQHSQRSDGFSTLSLSTGSAAKTSDDMTLEYVHGGIMWLVWSLMASIGIMSSSFRWIYPEGPIWFKIHRGMQYAVVILCVAGCGIAIAFTFIKEKEHFANLHMIFGLVVSILAVLQPINAVFRAHPPKGGWTNGKKPMKRIVWEIVHKSSGYIAWILGCVTVLLGLKLVNKNMILVYAHAVWFGLLIITYVVLRFIGYIRRKQEKEIEDVHDETLKVKSLSDMDRGVTDDTVTQGLR